MAYEPAADASVARDTVHPRASTHRYSIGRQADHRRRRAAGARPTKPSRLQQWLQSGLLNPQGLLLAAEFSLAVMADVLGRIVSLVDGLLWEHVTNASSVRLTERGAVPAYDRLCAEGVRARLWHSHSSGRMLILALAVS